MVSKGLAGLGRALRGFYSRHKLMSWLLLLLLAERLWALGWLGITYSLNNDDFGYVVSGINFANTGTVTMHRVLSAQIMPGMPWLLGLLSFIFGEGRLYLLAARLLWIGMGTATAFFVYRSVSIYAPKWCGVLACLPLAFPDFVWMDNLLLTETPFMLFLTICVYATLQMAKTKEKKYFWLCLAGYMLALMFKANIALYPLFAAAYLLLMRYPFKLLWRQGVTLAAAVLLFVVPWSIRNYVHFKAFVPLTYGAGNPLYIGTYQGEGWPEDSELDYDENVYRPADEKFAHYYPAVGKIEPYLQRYIWLEIDGIKAHYRMAQWWQKDPGSMLKSYLWLKPVRMINRCYYDKELLGISRQHVDVTRVVQFWCCVVALGAALLLRKRRRVLLFLSAVYMGNLLLYALYFAYERYAQSLYSVRLIVTGIGLALVLELLAKLRQKVVKSRDTTT